MQRTARFALFLVPLLALAPGCAKQSPSDSFSPADSDSSSSSDAQVASRFGEAKSAPIKDRGRRDSGGAAFEDEAAPSTAPGRSWDDADVGADAIAREQSRPGLGTAYGESRQSNVETVGFRRAEPSTPDVVFAIRYDDMSGVRAAARDHRSRAFRDEAMQQHGGLSFGLLDERGNILSAAAIGSDVWAVGNPDARYSLAIANDTNSAFEVVASVDGLDVIDGRPASFAKRGYIVDPFSSVVIDGWRTSEETVAAFRFSSIEDSYAERTGDGRNVGVIGAAFFREAPQAWDDWREPEDTWRRDRADPFPGREW